ncbi:MAG: pyridoxal phosphate-dependent aminotransferase [Clostridiaceae bacterium]|nr:pyridoxal phosphate-dependent aminotransferase [Clostridiaceae bacterium]
MVSREMHALGSSRSCIRELFEFGRKRAIEKGPDSVLDFSLGNPSIPAPQAVADAVYELIAGDPVALHGYTSAAGADAVRDAIAESCNRRFGLRLTRRNLFMTCGAAAALTATLGGLTLGPDTEFVAFAPFFPEYRVFASVHGGKLRIVPADEEAFQIDFTAAEAAITPCTQAVIINSPNNPSGVVYTDATLRRLAELLARKSQEFGHPVYLISDEPYRELVYGGITVPWVPDFYRNTLVCYSFSKSLSLPGERIGYALAPNELDDFDTVCDAIAGAARCMGHVCAPSLLQRVAAACVDVRPDVDIYERNAKLLYTRLTEMGYRCARPDGAFYLFFKAPHGMTAKQFSDRARDEHQLLLVPGDDFGCPNWLRLSFCAPTEKVERALPLLEKLMQEDVVPA